jgi:hypothetical protein
MGEEELTNKEIIRRSISIPKSMDNWLKIHPGINSSAIFRQSIYEIMSGDVIQTSLYGLLFFILISFSFLGMLFFLMPRQFMLFLIMAFMLVDAIILVSSVVLYNTYQKEIHKWTKMDMDLQEEKTP